MSFLDALILLTALTCAALSPFQHRRRAVQAGLPVLAVLAVWQLLREGFYWQFTPLYVLAAVLIVFSVLAVRGRLAGLIVVPLAVLCIAAWALLPAPVLPTPKGPYVLGTTVFRWVDANRWEDSTDEPTDHRNVIAQAWYPAEPARGPTGRYIDGLGRLPAKVNGLPGFLLESFRNIDTHAVNSAPASSRRAWPVVIFSPGYGAPRAFYMGLATDLASRGFVVIVLDHPYESAVTQLADGRLATPIERFLPTDPNRIVYMERQIRPRVGDVRYVLDKLDSPAGLGPLAGHIDPARVAVIGHSFGGATAALTLAQDRRPVAGADLDGMLYGGAEKTNLARPFLVLQSDPAIKPFSPIYTSSVAQLLKPLGSQGQRVVLTGAGHLSFTDAELFFAPPVRPVLRPILKARRPATRIQRQAADILENFLDEAFARNAAQKPAQRSV